MPDSGLFWHMQNNNSNLIIIRVFAYLGFPASEVKNTLASGDRGCRFDPWIGKIP